MTGPTRRTVGAILALLLTGCGGASETTAPTTSSPEATTTSRAPTTSNDAVAAELDGLVWADSDPSAAPVVVVVDPGAEPRAVRTWEWTAGTSYSMTMAMTTTIDQTVGDMSQVLEMTVEYDVIVEVLTVDERGAVVRSTYAEPNLLVDEPALKQQLEAEFAAVDGLVTYQLSAPSGAVLATAGLDDVPGSEFLPSDLGAVAALLPDAPIGSGAIWESRSTIDSMGVAVAQTTTVTVTDMTDDAISVEMEIVQEIDEAMSSLLGSQVVTFDSTGGGEAVWMLGRGFPASASSWASQEFELSVPVGEETQRVLQRLGLSLIMSTEPLN